MSHDSTFHKNLLSYMNQRSHSAKVKGQEDLPDGLAIVADQ